MKLEFIGTFFVILSLSKCSAVILDCNYYDTVDISHIEIKNDSYEYDGIPIPENLTGEYDFMMMPYFPRQPVTKHLRGCVCKLRPCIPVCCPRKNMLAHGECSDGYKDQLSRVNVHLNVTLEDNLIKALYFNNQVLLRTPFWEYNKMIGLRRDEYTLYENGTLVLHINQEVWDKEKYCLYPHQFYSDSPEIIWVVLHEWAIIPITAYYDITVISLLCYILTIAVYLYVKKLRNVLGNCLICSSLCIFITYSIWLLDELSLLNEVCSLAGYSSYFFDIASALWLFIISYHLWNTLTSLKREEPPNRFLTFSAFVWGTAAIPTGVIFLINHSWEKDLQKWNWMPIVGLSKCSVEVFKWSAWIYYYLLPIILNICGLIFFSLTARYILIVRRDCKRRRDGTTICFDFDSETSLIFFRISVTMGVSWILYFVSLLEFQNEFWQLIIIAIRYFQCGFGIVVFVALILKRSTIELLIDRIRGRK